MADYTLEPPRKDIHLHHTYDAIEPEVDRVLDTGPQGNDGSIVGDVQVRIPGIDGDAVRVEGDKNSHVSINAQPNDIPAITVASWLNFEEPVEPASNNVLWQLQLDGANTSMTWQFPETFEGWHFFLGWYDGSEMRIYHGTEDTEPELVASQAETGTVTNDFLLEVDMSFTARIDDTRVYKTDLSRDQRLNIWKLATERTLSPSVAGVWPTAALPYTEGEGNERFVGTLAQKTAFIERSLDQIREARHIDDAAGEQLDRIAELVGIRRRSGEADPQFRARIRATAIAGRSAGTFEDLLNGIAALLDKAEPDDIVLERNDTKIATADVKINANIVEESTITATDLQDAAQDMVLAGHALDVIKTNTNNFTLKADGESNDASLGLTSDSISTGGGLIEDL